MARKKSVKKREPIKEKEKDLGEPIKDPHDYNPQFVGNQK